MSDRRIKAGELARSYFRRADEDHMVERGPQGERRIWLLDQFYDQLARLGEPAADFPWLRLPGPETRPEDGSLAGKWLLFVSCNQAQPVWRKIAGAGFWQAKLSLTNQSPGKAGHVACIYTPDVHDLADLRETAIRLDQLGLIGAGKAIFYKPDLFTEDERYSGEASIFGLRGGSGYVFKTRGFSELPLPLRYELERRLEGLG